VLDNAQLKLLFICTHNRCRSIISEVVTRRICDQSIDVKSADSTPAGEVHPLTIHYLKKFGYHTDGIYSKGFADIPTFTPHLVVTLCDSAANEPCPVYLKRARKLHWGLTDPSRTTEDDNIIEAAFTSCFDEVTARAKAMKMILDEEKDIETACSRIAKLTKADA